jgi:hypothetical protein
VKPPSRNEPSKRHAFDADVKVVGGVRADGHEGPGTERDLPAEADQDIDPEGRQRQDQKGNQDGAEQVLVDQQRHSDERQQQKPENRPAILGDRKDLLIGGVGSLELTVFSI